MKLVVQSIFLGFVLLVGCLDFNKVAGGGSETGNGDALIGIINDEKGTPVEGATVWITKWSDSLSELGNEFIVQEKTSSSGIFRIEKLMPGTYNLLVYDSDTLNGALVNRTFGVENIRDTLKIISKKLSAIIVYVDLFKEQLPGQIVIPGMPQIRVYSEDVTNNYLTLGHLPQGQYREVFFINDSLGVVHSLLTDPLWLAEENVTLPRFNQWKYNTSFLWDSSVLSTSGIVYDYPLRVQLSSTDFGAALNEVKISTLRFSDGKGVQELNFEIESWDVSNNVADVWVQFDSINLNSNEEILQLYWHDSIVQDKNYQVFDTSAGFIDVWHMDQIRGVQSVTQTKTIFTSQVSKEADTLGVVGRGSFFDGDSIWMRADSVEYLNNLPLRDYTVCVWVFSENTSTGKIISKRISNSSFIGGWDLGIEFPSGQSRLEFYTHYSIQDMRFASPRGSIPLGEWVYVCAEVSAAEKSAQLYINGEPVVHELEQVGVGTLQDDSMNRMVIGTSISTLGRFHGILDEARLIRGKWGASKIKLDYITQSNSSVLRR